MGADSAIDVTAHTQNEKMPPKKVRVRIGAENLFCASVFKPVITAKWGYLHLSVLLYCTRGMKVDQEAQTSGGWS